jgi:hypothetical protein
VFSAFSEVNRNRFYPASQKGRFNGLVDEGDSLRQKLALQANPAETCPP